MPTTLKFIVTLLFILAISFSSIGYAQEEEIEDGEVEETFEEDALVPTVVECGTTKGPITIQVYSDWAPIGASRFLNLVEDGFFSDIGMFRSVENFLTQFGISDQPQFKITSPSYPYPDIQDDEDMRLGIRQYYMSFAGSGANSRGTQVFIALADLDWLGPREENGEVTGTWETPFGKVVRGFDVLDNLYKGYGDEPQQQLMHEEGNAYLRRAFPLLDYITSCRIDGRADVDARTVDELMVHAAASLGDTSKVRYVHLIEPDAIHLADENKWQALHEATRGGHLDVVQFLVDSGADVGAKTVDGGTALWWARRFLEEDHPVIGFLESIGAPDEGQEL